MRRALLQLVGIYAALAVMGCLAGFVVAPPNHGRGPFQGIDNWAYSLVLAHTNPSSSWLKVARDVKYVGTIELLVPLVAIITFALWKGGLRSRAFAPALSLAGTGLLVEPLKYLIRRPEPAATATAHLAFPSGHTAAITAVMVPLATLAWVTRRWWWPSVVAIGFMSAVGISMLIVQGHWLTDVISGALLAAVWGVAVAVLLPDRIGAAAESEARRETDARTEQRPAQPPPWHRPAEWMS